MFNQKEAAAQEEAATEDKIYKLLEDYEKIDMIKSILKNKYITEEEIAGALICFKNEAILPLCFKRLNMPQEEIIRYAVIYLSKQLNKHQKMLLNSRNSTA